MLRIPVCALATLLFLGGSSLEGYAVLTHEAVIDATWDNIKPVLLERFPAATEDDLKQAHAYTYGGCIIQDMGYYPFGSHYFSDLVHYVRSGDFVVALLREAQNLNEFAFALGALAHYSADNHGHPIAVNRAVAIEFPVLRAKFGNSVTYAQDKQAHLKTEFGFDVVEVARGNYAPENYHDFIGFQVSKELLERAFLDTYSIELKKQFTSLDLALGTYRHTVSSILPEATKVAWQLKKDEIVKARPGMTRRRFMYNIKRSSYEKEWGSTYQKPGFGARLLAFLFRIIPKIGPFKSIAFKPPTAQTETLFMQSFNETISSYKANLQEEHAGHLHLPNMDFDTGRPTHPGEYSLADETYAQLLRDLAKQQFKRVTPELRADLLAFYASEKTLKEAVEKAPPKQRKDWTDALAALEGLKAAGEPAPTTPAK